MTEPGREAPWSDILFLVVGVEQGYLTDRQVDDVVGIQAKMLDLGVRESTSRICVKKNFVTEAQAEEVTRLVEDRSRTDADFAVGRLATTSARVAPAALLAAFRKQRRDRHRQALGDILQEEGLVTEEERRSFSETAGREAGSKTPGTAVVTGSPARIEGTPTHLGNYEILEELSRGGMGVVYRARQRSLDRVVALKILSSDLVKNREFIERFQREAKAIGESSHPSIVQVFDYGKIQGYHFIAMEFVDGESLDSILEKRGPLSVANAAVLGESIARGLMEANKKGVVHRDVKPSNLLVSKSGQVKITDFGLAKIVEGPDDAAPDLTQRGTILGSPHYIAPEQARGEAIDFRVDMYSLGVTLFKAMVGTPPFDAPTSIQIIAKHLNAPLPPREKLPREIPPEAYSLVKWLMAKKPEGRPPSWQKVVDLCRELREVTQAQKCPNCGNSLKAGDVICIECGLNLKTGVQLKIEIGGGAPPRKRKRRARPTPVESGADDDGSSTDLPIVVEEPAAGLPDAETKPLVPRRRRRLGRSRRGPLRKRKK